MIARRSSRRTSSWSSASRTRAVVFSADTVWRVSPDRSSRVLDQRAMARSQRPASSCASISRDGPPCASAAARWRGATSSRCRPWRPGWPRRAAARRPAGCWRTWRRRIRRRRAQLLARTVEREAALRAQASRREVSALTADLLERLTHRLRTDVTTLQAVADGRARRPLRARGPRAAAGRAAAHGPRGAASG